MCAQAISICIPFSSLEGTNDVCTLKRILYMLFGRVGACDEWSGASEKELQVLSAYGVPTYPQRQSRRRQGSGAGCVGLYRADRHVGHPLADRQQYLSAVEEPTRLRSGLRWAISGRQGCRPSAGRQIAVPIGSRGAHKAPERAASGCIGPIGLSAIRWPMGTTQPIEEEKGAKSLRRNNQIYIKKYFICIF